MQLLSRVDGFSGSLVGLTAWSFARLKHANTELFSALSRRACQLAQQKQLKPLDANQLVCAAAKLGFRDDVLFRACAGVSVLYTDQWLPVTRALSNMCWHDLVACV